MKFKARWYQSHIIDAIENNGFRKVLAILGRRGGKDITAWNIAIRQCKTKVCLVLYALPTYSQGRKCIFDAIASDGTRFIDYIEPEWIHSINSSEMKIRFKNNSILQIIGADSYNTSLVGTNCYGLVLSEACLMDLDNVYAYARPILAANGGWCLIVSTPRGKNALYRLWEFAKDDPGWFVMKMGVDETKHIPADVIAQEQAQMDPGLFAQEYLVSFEKGQVGLIWGDVLDKLKQDGRHTICNHDPSALTHVVMDIGWNDATAIIWFQTYGDGQVIKIIDYFESDHRGLDFYVDKVLSKPYRRGTVFYPHDIKVHEFGNYGRTRLSMAQEMGLDGETLEQMDKEVSIDITLATFSKIWIDERNCQRLIDALENYRREWDDKNSIYKKDTVRNFAAHGSDALRYMVQAVNLLAPSTSAAEFDKAKQQALYGNTFNHRATIASFGRRF